MNWRKYHRIVSLFVLAPFLLVILTGIPLLLRTKSELIQPTMINSEKIPNQEILSFNKVMSLREIKKEEVDQIIFRPEKFQLVVRLKNFEEIHLHPQTGEVLKKAKRWTSLLIELHQGSFFGEWSQFFIFLPSAFGLLFLVVSGVIIYPRRKNYEK